MLREHFAKVNRREADATTILLNPTANNTQGNIAASGAVPLSIKELIDTKVEGLELPADLTLLTGVQHQRCRSAR